MHYLDFIDIKETEEKFGLIKGVVSKVIAVCSSCGNKKQTSVKLLKRTLKKRSQFLCTSCVTKEKWSNSEYAKKVKNKLQSEETKTKISAKVSSAYSNPKLIKKRSQIHKSLWKDSAYREKQQSIRNSNEFKSKQSKISKAQWADRDYRKNATKHWDDFEFIEKFKKIVNSEAYIQVQQEIRNEEWKLKQSAASKKLWEDPHYKKKTTQCWQDPKFRSLHAKKAKVFLSSGKDSIIERVTQQILDQLNIKFERQKVIGPYSFDLFIPSHNLLIECQGEYWHSSDRAKQRDSAKFTYIDKYFPDHKILYLYERDFLNPGIVKQKLIRELFDSEHVENRVDFSFSDLIIDKLSVKTKLAGSYYSEAEEFLQSFHYAGFGRSPKQIFGSYLGNQLIAVCKFSSVVRKEVATSIGLKTSEVLELDRFCIHPSYQKKNFASWFIAKSVKSITDPKLTHLISFADSTFGHDGTIYKAANWQQISTVKPSYHYINEEGWVLHKKTVWDHAKKMSKSEHEYAEENNYQKVYGKEKVKFILRL